MMINIGCGPDIKLGWVNTDNCYDPKNPDRPVWDIRHEPFPFWDNQFNFALVNHVLCVLPYNDIIVSLKNIRECLKEGGVIEIIDVDIMKAYEAYAKKNHDFFKLLPEATLDERFARYLGDYYMRESLFTEGYLKALLERTGFNDVKVMKTSKHDLRPAESLIVRGTK